MRRWESEGAQPVKAPRTTIEELKENFLQDAHARHLNHETIRKYDLVFRQLTEFAKNKGVQYVDEINLPFLTDFRAGWSDAALSASKKLERLRSIFKFAVARKWVPDNPALELKPPKIRPSPTLPFTAEEMKRILKTVEGKRRVRLLAFILTMRYSGLRISDTTKLEVTSLKDNRLTLYQAKTGEPVSVLLPKSVADALHALPRENEKYYFWTGQSKLVTAISIWYKQLVDVFDEAGIPKAHSHRFRDTFAVACLEAGMTLEDVSNLLGHSSIKVTEKHYSPWVKSRQNRLDQEMERVNRMQSAYI